jgi:hypothetical protein
MSLILSSTERSLNRAARSVHHPAQTLRDVQGLPLPLIVNADLIVGKDDLTMPNQVK